MQTGPQSTDEPVAVVSSAMVRESLGTASSFSVEDAVCSGSPLPKSSPCSPNANDGGLEELRLQISKLSVTKDEDETKPVKEELCFKALPSRGIAGLASSNPATGSSNRSKGFILNPQHAHMLLLNRVYFVVFPRIYVFDQHGIICWVDPTNDQYHEVDLRPSPNPPGSESVFQLSGITYWFDRSNQLWYTLDGLWYAETTYLDLTAAQHEVARCAEQNRLAAPLGGPSSVTSPVTSPVTTVTNSPYQDSTDDDYLYQPLSSRPDQDEIDRWMVEFKARRNALIKTRERVGDIRCPLEECRKPQRRPQALRDHLYFHFGIKPYKCDYNGCVNAFETEASKYRHMESCAYRQLHGR